MSDPDGRGRPSPRLLQMKKIDIVATERLRRRIEPGRAGKQRNKLDLDSIPIVIDCCRAVARGQRAAITGNSFYSNGGARMRMFTHHNSPRLIGGAVYRFRGSSAPAA